MNREAGGLFSGNERVPLLGVHIHVKAHGASAHVSVAQRYHNAEKDPIEAVYSFPLPESAAVNQFEVEIGGKQIVGRVEEKEKAFDEYDAAMAAGHGAFLLDQDRPNIFTASVGNLAAGQEAVVRLGYAFELEQTRDGLRLMIPTTISPRYVPKQMEQSADPAELDRLNPPTVLGRVPYGLNLEVDLQAAVPIKEVSCPSHPAGVRLQGESVHVELMGTDIQLDQDFVLNVAYQTPHATSALVAREPDGTRIVMLNLFPDLSGCTRPPCEFLFVVDRSGSMGGESIGQARGALQLALKSLEDGDFFNVIGFGSEFESLFTGPVPYNQANLEVAVRHAEKLNADLGGTELLKPLQVALAGAERTRPRLIMLLTDGQVGNDQECIDAVAAGGGAVRIFTFGIGRGASEYLVRGLARASGGQAEFIHPGERIEPKVLRQFGRIASAFLENVRIDWGKLKCDLVAPGVCPPLFDGDAAVVYARLTGGTAGEVAILADGPKGALRFPVVVDPENAVADSAIGVLMARQAITDLEEGRSVTRSGSNQRPKRKEQKTREQVLQLALRYQLASSATSFVAVEERAADATQPAAKLRRVPIALTKGWGALEMDITTASVCFAAPSSTPASGGQLRLERAAPRDAIPPQSSSWLGRALGAIRPSRSAGPPAAPAHELSAGAAPPDMIEGLTLGAGGPPMAQYDSEESEITGDALLQLVGAQQADGGFALTDELLQVAGTSRRQMEIAARQLPSKDGERILATLLALELLESHFKDRRVEWRLLAKKAERWLSKQQLPAIAGFSSLRDWARTLLP